MGIRDVHSQFNIEKFIAVSLIILVSFLFY